MLQKIPIEYSDWHCWRAGSPADLFLVCREPQLIAMRNIIRTYAVGYCNSEHILCRPKLEHKAVMFFKDGINFWFHLTNKEFGVIFYET